MKKNKAPIHGLNKTMKRLKHGVTLYKVYAFPEMGQGFIEKVFVLSKPYIINGYATIDVVSSNGGYPNTSSLMDMHFYPQRYNTNKAFFSERKAKRYLKLALSGTDMSNYFLTNQ